MKALVLTALAVLLTTTAAEPRDFSGQARALDGDDILLCDGNTCTDMRLCGIDAPERGCPCYDEATKALQALVQGKQVKCIQVGGGTPCDGKSPSTNRNRVIAQCFVDGTDIGGVLVERGLACDWETFSGGYYSRNGKGHTCPPQHRTTCQAAPAPACRLPACAIKGSRSGIYHMPGCGSYAMTTSVKQWFCSEDEAVAAGYRKANNCPSTGEGR
jgi:endonuclease YncB( thermonuclease family)